MAVYVSMINDLVLLYPPVFYQTDAAIVPLSLAFGSQTRGAETQSDSFTSASGITSHPEKEQCEGTYRR